MNKKQKPSFFRSLLHARSPEAGKSRRTPVKFVLITLLIIGALQLSTVLFAPTPEKDAWGKLLSPQTGSPLRLPLVIVGATQDIPSGHFIWTAIEYETGFCLPLKRVLRNSRFRTTIDSIPISPPFSVSLFVLNETQHRVWSDKTGSPLQQEIKSHPAPRRLDSIHIVP